MKTYFLSFGRPSSPADPGPEIHPPPSMPNMAPRAHDNAEGGLPFWSTCTNRPPWARPPPATLMWNTTYHQGALPGLPWAFLDLGARRPISTVVTSCSRDQEAPTIQPCRLRSRRRTFTGPSCSTPSQDDSPRVIGLNFDAHQSRHRRTRGQGQRCFTWTDH